jgi:hypothetical protein
MATIDNIRAWALALPGVEEKEHFRFRTPLWKVRGKTFLGIGRDADTAVFCVSEESANRLVAAHPGRVSAERRSDARRSFLGAQIPLDAFADQQLRALVREAWCAQAPKRLASSIEDPG